MARFLVQTIPNKLPEFLMNLSSQGPHLMGATLPTPLRAVHPGTIAQFDSHNSIYRRSRTTCDSSCSFLGRERHTQAAALDYQ